MFKIIPSLFQNVLETSLYASIVTLCIFAVRFYFRKKFPAWFSYALWGIVLFRLLLPMGVIPSPISIFNFEKPVREIAMAISQPGNSDTVSITAVAEIKAPDIIEATLADASYASSGVYQASATARQKLPPLIIISFVWLSGLALFILYSVIAHIITLRRLRFAVYSHEQKLLNEYAESVGTRRRARLVVSDLYGSPVVCGLFHPRIILPSALDNAGRDLLRPILIHELIHIKRYDLLWNLLGTLVLAIHWFNPVIWAAAILSRRDRERSCDERTLFIINDNKRYAETLLAISALQSSARTPLGALAFGEEGVKERIKSALNFQKKNRIVVLISAIFVIVISAALATSAADRKISVRAAGRIIMKDPSLHDAGPNDKLVLEEFGDDSIFKETGMQIFKAVGEFHKNDAFIIRDGFVQEYIRGYGGYGIHDMRLSDFNGDGKKEIIYTNTWYSNRMYSNINIYDPWSRSSWSGSCGTHLPIELLPISDDVFILIITETGKQAGSITRIMKGNENDYDIIIDTSPYYAEESFNISAYPNPYTTVMSSSPGMRLDVSYWNDSSLYSAIRYRAENGTFLVSENGIITDLGNDAVLLRDRPIYWSPGSNADELYGDTLTITIIYRPDTPDRILYEAVIPIFCNEYGFYFIGEGSPPATESISDRQAATTAADLNGDGIKENIEIVFRKIGERIVREQNEYPFIRTVINGVVYEEFLGYVHTYATSLFPYRLNNEDKEAVVAVFDGGGTGMGNFYFSVLEFDNGFKFLPVPSQQDGYMISESFLFGFKADIEFMNGYKAGIFCPETGFYGEFALDRDYWGGDLLYDSMGNLNGKYIKGEIDGVCSVSIVNINGRECVEIAQYVWGISHPLGIGLFVTDLAWENGEYVVVEQRCDVMQSY